MVDQLNRLDVAVRASHDLAHRLEADVHAAARRASSSTSLHVDSAVEHHGEPAGQLAEKYGGVQPHRVGDDLNHALIPKLEAMAERTVNDVASPAFGKSVDLWQHVHQARGDEHPACDDVMTAVEFDSEAIAVGPGDNAYVTGENLAAIASDLLATRGGQLRGWKPFSAEVTVDVGCRSVAGLTRVDDDHRPALATQLEYSG